MANLRRNYNRFVLRNRDKGIPNLMLWICGANAVVFIMYYFFYHDLLSLLNFNADLILQGQVWRLFSYIFTFACGNVFLFSEILGAVISIMFYYWVGSMLEHTWGTLRLNIFYFTGVILSDVFVLVVLLVYRFVGPLNIFYSIISATLNSSVSSHYINLSMFLAVATLSPEQRVYIYMIIPVKMKWLAWVDLGITAIGLVNGLVQTIRYWALFGAYVGVGLLMVTLFPLVALLNYFLFFGRGIRSLLPNFRRSSRKRRQQFRTPPPPPQEPNPDWAKNYRSSTGARPYRHKCTVCGRTDTDCPDLEFRYCSKCKGYFCYCIDHINNHTHVQ